MSSDDFEQKLLIDQALIGRVITQATTIESMIDAYIADFYTRCPNGNYQNSYLSFIYDIMNERSVSLNTKLNILYKIHKRLHGKPVSGQTKKLFEDWLRIRNKFAHGHYIADKGILYNGEFYPVEDLASQHAELQLKINEQLLAYDELRGPYFNQFPVSGAQK